MELSISVSATKDSVTIISLSGKMNAITVSELKALLKKSIEEGSIRMIVDLSAVDFMDSSGLSALISALKGCREKGGFLRLVNLQAQVRRVFELTLLDRVFEVYASVDAALA